MENIVEDMEIRRQSVNYQARMVVMELKGLLQSVYAGREIQRQRVQTAAERGRELSVDREAWPGGDREVYEYLGVVDGLEKQIYQAMDFRKLKDEGFLRAVSF